jgi:hypothetical protein
MHFLVVMAVRLKYLEWKAFQSTSPSHILDVLLLANSLCLHRSDIEAWRRRKEQEAGIAAGSLSQPAAKRPKLDKRPISEAELAIKLAAHRALMSGGDVIKTHVGLSGATASGAPTVFGAPQVYAPGASGPPSGLPGGPPFPVPPPFLAPPPGALGPG